MAIPPLSRDIMVVYVSWDLVEQGAYMTYCWIGPCQAPDVNFGELITSCIA